MKTKYKILIVEDEPLIADDIAFILEDEGYQISGKAIDTDEAIDLIKSTHPDIVLLDISLEDGEDGVELAHRINDIFNIPFVFITSHSDKLTVNRVKKTNPCGFIVKPFKPEEIISTVAIALYKSKNNNSNQFLTDDGFFVKQGHDLVKIAFNDILYIKADDNYTTIFLSNKKVLASLNLKSISEKLPSKRFLRVHRSFVINISRITRISHRFVFIDEHEVPLGKGNFQMLQEFIMTL